MRTVKSLLALLLSVCLLATSTMAGSADAPEVEDDRGDVDVQHLVDAGLLDEDASEDELENSGDILQAWVDKETAEAFEIKVELADIPDDSNVSSPVVEVWTHFTVREGSFHAAARLSSPQEGSPTQANFELYEGQALISELAGDVDVEQDRVSFLVPKPNVNDPAEDDELSEFYVTTHAPATQAPLDYAPGANERSLPNADQAQSADPRDLELSPTPTYGKTYRFQISEGVGSEISVSITPSSLEVPAGEQATFSVRVDNDGDASDSVSLSLSNTPPGWSADVQPGSLSVDARSSETAKLYVTPPEGAEGHQLVDVRAVSDRGADKGATASIVAVQPDDPSSEDASQAPADEDGDGSPPASQAERDGEEDVDESEEEENGAPFVSPLAALAVIGAVAVLLRRRA